MVTKYLAPKGFTLEQALADAEAGLKRCEEMAYSSIAYIPLPRGRDYANRLLMAKGGALEPKGQAPKRGPSPLTIDAPIPMPRLPSGGQKVNIA